MPTIVHIDIASDDPERAKKYYESLFGWKSFSPPGMTDFYLVETEALDGSRGVGGGIGKRGDPSQKITAYIGVDDVEAYGKQVEIPDARKRLFQRPVARMNSSSG